MINLLLVVHLIHIWVLLEILLVIVLLIHSLHHLLPVHISGCSARSLVALHNLVLLVNYFVFETDRAEALVSGGGEGSDLLFPEFGGSDGVLLVDALGSAQGFSTLYRAIVAEGLAWTTIEGAFFGISSSILARSCAETMEEIRILAVSIAIASYHLLQLNILDVVASPFIIVIRTFSFLQFVE